MINEEWINNIKNWLEDGEDLAENIIDIPWNVEVSEGETSDALYCTHPSTPFDIMAVVSKEFATLYLDTHISTDTYDNIEKMRYYKKLLALNLNLNLSKATLTGDTDSVALCVDLDLSSLGKTEFNHALDGLLYGSMTIVNDVFHLKDELYNWFLEQITNDCAKIFKEGKKKGDMVHYLVYKVGWEKKESKKFVDELIVELKKAAPMEEHSEAGTGTMGVQ